MLLGWVLQQQVTRLWNTSLGKYDVCVDGFFFLTERSTGFNTFAFFIDLQLHIAYKFTMYVCLLLTLHTTSLLSLLPLKLVLSCSWFAFF